MEGNTHNTLVGGCWSILINGFMICYLLTLIHKFGVLRGDTITTNTVNNDLSLLNGTKI